MYKKKPKNQIDFLNRCDDDLKDSDHDGISDREEKILGTNPYSCDTDKDGIDDFQEIKLGQNPCGRGSIKNLFIPHEGNDYQPGALNPKRLLFYGVSAIAIKFIALFLVIFIPVTAWLTPDVMTEQSKRIVSLTNDLRVSKNLNTLQENNLLDQAAAKKAQDMLINQYFAHVGPDNKRVSTWMREVGYAYRIAGENLAMGFSTPEQVVNAWIASPTHYANLIDEDFVDIGVAMVSGPYNSYDTTLVAQFFGKPVAVKPTPEPEPIVQPKPTPVPEPTPTPVPIVQPKPTPVPEPTPEVIPTPTPTPEPEPVVQPELIPVLEPELPVITDNEVLAERQEIPEPTLSIPQLIYPANEFLTSDNKVEFNILAIDAEKVSILVDDQLVWEQAKNTSQDTLTTTIELEEGIHNIKLAAAKNDLKSLSASYIIIIDNTIPVVDQTRSSLLIDEPEGKTEKIVKAEAYLSSDTTSVYIQFANQRIDLEQDILSGVWSGQAIIPAEKEAETFSPIVLATLTATDFAGNVLVTDIDWENIKPMETSVLSQYVYLKTHSNQDTKSIFSLSTWYYKILLLITVIALGLNVFIHIRKQRLKLIASSAGLIGLLLILIII